MSGASQRGPHTGWAPEPPHLKMPPCTTVNVSAVSATLSAGGATPSYSPASSPYAHGSSRSSPAYISRTGSGSSEGGASNSAGDLAAAALQALGRQASLTAAAAGPGSSTGASSSPHGASTPHPNPGRSNLGPAALPHPQPLTQQQVEVEASLQGLPRGAEGPASTRPDTFDRSSQDEGTGPSGRSQHHGIRGTRNSSGGAYGAEAAGSYGPSMAHQGAFFVGSPPGGYGMPPGLYAGPHAGGMAPGPGAAGYPAHAYYPQAMSGPQQQGFVMHPYFGLIPAQHAAAAYVPPLAPYGAYGAPTGRGTGGKYDADYARQYQAMMSYMQGFGMMVSPSGSPERTSRPMAQATFRRNGHGQGNGSGDRGRVPGRPSRLSLDMSASKSENGDAHKLDPELAPLVAEDKAELQSEVLDEFKANREGRQWTLQDIRGHLYPFCRDQHGSRLVQQQLEGADAEAVSELFAEVRHKLMPLMVDVFGNYVVQRFLDRGGDDVRAAVAEAIRGKVLPLSLQVYGCRVVQKALEVLPPEERVSICAELTEHTLRCVRDQNGNHVVQKVIECVQPSDPARQMIETIVNKGQTLSTHTFGCRLVQRVLEFCSIAELREKVISDVLGTTLQLSHDQYGNYVVQHLVNKGPVAAREAIVAKVAPQVMTLAQHKYASNVVEACLKHGAQAHRDAIIEQMIREAALRPATLTALMRDQFGNYVVQRCLDMAMPAQRQALLEAIQPHVEQLRKYTYGKHIASKVEAMLAAQAEADGADGEALPAALQGKAATAEGVMH